MREIIALPAFVLAYHGCELETLQAVLSGQRLKPSTNDHDWLGSGGYFWEHNHQRAHQWACDHGCRVPAVLGAVVDLGNCLNLLDARGLEVVRAGYESLGRLLTEAGTPMPTNTPSSHPDRPIRRLDCAVITHLFGLKDENGPVFTFDTVRAMFPEGRELYPNAGFLDKNHIQICVRNPAAIKAFFRVPFKSECREAECGSCGLVCIEEA